MFTVARSDARVTVTEIPSFVSTLPFLLDGMVATLRDASRAWLLAAPYSSTGCSALILISLTDNTVEKLPLHADGAPVIVASADDSAWLGTLDGRILRFTLATRALDEIARTEARFTIGAAHDGILYFGAQDGDVLAVHPASGRVTRAFTTPGAVQGLLSVDGRVVAIAGTPPELLTLNPATGDLTGESFDELPVSVCAVPHPDGGILLASRDDARVVRVANSGVSTLPALPEGDACACLARVGDAVLASGRFTGALYRLAADGWDILGVPMPNDPLCFIPLADGRIAGVTGHGRQVQSTTDWHMYSIASLPARASCGLHIRSIVLGSDRRLYFAPCAGARLGCWDPETDEATELFIASTYPGAIGPLGVAGERIFIAFGDPCGVMSFHPEMPYRLLENPRLLGLAGDGLRRPVGRMHYLLGQLYFAAEGATDGAIVHIEPNYNRLTVFTSVVPGAQLTRMAADRLNGLLIAGSRTEYGPAQVACWSPETGETTTLITPFPDAVATYAAGAEGGRAYIPDGGDRLAVLAPATGEVLETGRFPLGAVTSLIATSHGELFGLAGGWLFQLDPDQRRIIQLAEIDGDCLTEGRRGRFAVTCDGRLYTVQVW